MKPFSATTPPLHHHQHHVVTSRTARTRFLLLHSYDDDLYTIMLNKKRIPFVAVV